MVGNCQNQCIHLRDKNILANGSIKSLVKIERNEAVPSTFSQMPEHLITGRPCNTRITCKNIPLQQNEIISTEMM